MRISVVIPVLNEARGQLSKVIASASLADEILLVDGGSNDGTQALIQSLGLTLLSSPKGRAEQMNAGAALATGEKILFLHADVILPIGWKEQLSNTAVPWGRFDVFFAQDGSSVHQPNGTGKDHLIMAGIAWFMNWRSRITGISTGDQCQFFDRSAFETLGGFATIPLMEDVEISTRAKKILGPPLNIALPVAVSPRRWRAHGYLKTIVLMWRLRWQYWRGTPAEKLHKLYYGGH